MQSLQLPLLDFDVFRYTSLRNNVDVLCSHDTLKSCLTGVSVACHAVNNTNYLAQLTQNGIQKTDKTNGVCIVLRFIRFQANS